MTRCAFQSVTTDRLGVFRMTIVTLIKQPCTVDHRLNLAGGFVLTHRTSGDIEVVKTSSQGFQKWRFGAKVAILRGSVSSEFCRISLRQKWRFFIVLENWSKSGVFRE